MRQQYGPGSPFRPFTQQSQLYVQLHGVNRVPIVIELHRHRCWREKVWTMCSWAYGVQSYGRRSSGLTACSNPTPMHLVGVSLTSAVTKSSPHSQSKIEEAIVVLGCAARQPPHVRYTRLPTYCVASGRCHGLKPSIGMLLAMGCIAALSDGNRTRRNEIATR